MLELTLDSSLMVDPSSVTDMEKALIDIYNNAGIRMKLIRMGLQRVNVLKDNNSFIVLKKLLNQYELSLSQDKDRL